MMFRITAYRKYFYYFLNFTTTKKLLNIARSSIAMRNGQQLLRTYPYKITFDPGNICNLRCPGCHTGIKHPEMIRPSFMEFDDFVKMFNKVKDHTISIALYNWGEPLLNKQIFKMIRYARQNKVGTTLHSNFNHFNEQMAEELVKSGLTHIYLSIDGATQNVYSQYRVKGNLDKVIKNVELLVRVKKKAGSQLPFITWKYLVFPHNRHEVKAARQMAKKTGVDNFEVFTAVPKIMDLYDERKNYEDDPKLLSVLPPVCKSLWSSAYIQPDGSLMPCSLAFRKKESFGNLLHDDIATIWNNENYINARKMFDQYERTEPVSPCSACKYSLICGENSRSVIF
jgi:radical SAM protein with 4Fe4S-binding SPASM domain